MSVVEDLRKLLQEVVAPDLKALDARLTAIEKKLDFEFEALEKKFDLKTGVLDKNLDLKTKALNDRLELTTKALDDKIDFKFDNLDKKIDAKHDLVMAEIRNLATVMAASFARIDHSLDLDWRLERIENERAQASRKPRLERTA